MTCNGWERDEEREIVIKKIEWERERADFTHDYHFLLCYKKVQNG